MNIITSIFALLFSFSVFASDNSDLTINYINSTKYPEELKIKAEYLVQSLNRINSENWNNQSKVFDSISKDISISLSCYIHASKRLSADTELDLISEIQMLMSDDNTNIQYIKFMERDMPITHKISSDSICAALL